AEVADGAGQKETASATLLTTPGVQKLTVLPEGGDLVKGVANRVYILVTGPDGSPIPDVRLTASGAEDELRTDDHRLASLELTPATARVELFVRALNKHGEETAFLHQQLHCGDESDDFLLRPSRGVYRAGETLKLTAQGADGPVFVDLIRHG